MFKMTKALNGHMKGVNDLQEGDGKAKKAKAAKIKKEKASSPCLYHLSLPLSIVPLPPADLKNYKLNYTIS